MIYQTERLLIRPTNIEDGAFILELLNTPKWHKFIGNRNVNTLEDAVNYIQEKMLPQLERLGYSNCTVIRKSDNIKIGTCGVYVRDGLETPDIGFAFLPQFEGQGYAYESANKVLHCAFTDYGLKNLQAITSKNNKRSQKLLEKLGLKFVKFTQLPNDHEELMLYEINKSSVF